MAFLVIAGITVPVSGVVTKAREQGGLTSRAFAGNLRSTVRWSKRTWVATTKILPEIDALALEAAIADGEFVTCSGDYLGGDVTALVTLGDATAVKVATPAGGWRRPLVLTIREV